MSVPLARPAADERDTPGELPSEIDVERVFSIHDGRPSARRYRPPLPRKRVLQSALSQRHRRTTRANPSRLHRLNLIPPEDTRCRRCPPSSENATGQITSRSKLPTSTTSPTDKPDKRSSPTTAFASSNSCEQDEHEQPSASSATRTRSTATTPPRNVRSDPQ